MARVMAVGMAAATSCAKEGPPRVPMGLSGAYSRMTCDMRRKVFSSMPLLAERRTWSGGEDGRDLLHDGAQGLRGRDAEDDVGAGDGVGEVGGDVRCRREG